MKNLKTLSFPVMALLLAVALSGCPSGKESEYNLGFNVGFLNDAKYWEGFDDSYETVPDGPIFYAGASIPELTDGSYDAGYWDGIWYAYNDGYFVCYDYAFMIGFSEGYDAAYQKNWKSFLLQDSHPEYLDGSFEDGYNDGFTEGSVFGADDYKRKAPFNWQDALWDYRDNIDVYLDELGFGTGEWGDVFLYEYGTDPHEFYKTKNAAASGTATRLLFQKNNGGRGLRGTALQAKSPVNAAAPKAEELEIPALSYRSLPGRIQQSLPTRTLYVDRRQGTESHLNTTRLQRINAYRDAIGKNSGE